MAKRSAYLEFVSVLRKHWRIVLPMVEPLAEPLETLPKASTFYAGVAGATQRHVFLNFQPDANKPGQFTINVVVAKDPLSARLFHPAGADANGGFGVGAHRIGRFVETRHADKWWCLCRDERNEARCAQQGKPWRHETWWYPASYDDQAAVIRAAVADVTCDVKIALEELGIPAGANEMPQE